MGQVNKSRIKKLTKRQLDVIDDIFENSGKESEVIKKHKVSRGIYRKWLNDENFVDELAFRFESAKRLSGMIMAKFAPNAAVKLVELIESEKEETSRKACLDVMAQPVAIYSPKIKGKNVRENISSEAAERMLAAMAKEERKKV